MIKCTTYLVMDIIDKNEPMYKRASKVITDETLMSAWRIRKTDVHGYKEGMCWDQQASIVENLICQDNIDQTDLSMLILRLIQSWHNK